MKKYKKPEVTVKEYQVKRDIALQEYYYLNSDSKKVSLFLLSNS